MDLFTSKQTAIDTNTKTAAGKISNGTAIVVTDLAREPAKGLRQVVSHVQKSVPGIIETQRGLDAATLQLQAVVAELQDAKEAVGSSISPATQQDLNSLAASISQLRRIAIQQQKRQQQQPVDAAAAGTAGALAGSSSSIAAASSSIAAASSSLVKSLTNPANLWRAA